MPDQPQPTSPPSNNSRITAMLQDLAAQRAGGTPPPRQPADQPTAPIITPRAPAPTLAPPRNLPIGQAGVFMPSRPGPMSPVAPAPMPIRPPVVPRAPIAGAIVPPRPSAPPPAPREPIAPVVPLPPRPVAPMPSSIRQAPVAPIAPKPMPVAPLSPPKAPPTGGLPAQEGYSAELRTMSADIGNIKVGQAPAGIRQSTSSASAPIVTPAAPPVIMVTPNAPTTPTIIVVPSTGSSGGGFFRKMIYGVLGAIVFVGIAYAIVSMLGDSSSPQATASPSPSTSTSSSPAPTLGSKSLRSYFPQAGPNISLRGDDTARPDLLNAIATSNPASRQALRLGLMVGWPDTSAYGFLSAMTGAAPAALAQTLGVDWIVLSYGQQEQFDFNGVRIENSTTSARLIIIAEVIDASAANQVMTSWESVTLASSADILFSYDTSKAIVSGFSSGTYRQVLVRYWNFPYADRSIDYAIVTASNGKNYLVLAGSREAAFFAIDQLMQ